MSSYQEQAQAEMWDAAASTDEGFSEGSLVKQDEYGDAVFRIVGRGRNGDLILRHMETLTTHHAQPLHLRLAR